LLYSILINGKSFSFNPDNPGMALGLLFGILAQKNEKLVFTIWRAKRETEKELML